MKGLVSLYCLFFITFFGLSQDWKKDLNSARKLYKEGNYAASLKKYQAAQKTAPKDIDLSDEIGQASYKANEFTKAEKNFNHSSSKKGNVKQQAKTYHNLGNAKMKQKKYAEAVESYKESLRKNPSDDETRYNLSEAMKQKKKQEEQNQKKNQDQEKQQNNQPQDKKENQEKEEKQNNKNKQDQQNQQNKKNNESNSGQEAKLTDKKTERLLDELQKKEMETKKKLDKNKGKSSKKVTGKDW